MTSEVRMPQLGMNQDSATILTWLKTAGDVVAAGDVLFEVETDKATMEVEARTAGFLSGIRAREGDEVPVGDVIAFIVATEAEVAAEPADDALPASESPAEDPARSAETCAGPEQPAEAGPVPRSRKPVIPAMATGRVLASPKARRIAAERGIDLVALRARGAAEPIHAADLSGIAAGGQSVLMARVNGDAFNALLERSESAHNTQLMASFAAGAWRAVFEVDDIAVALLEVDGASTVHVNPDRGGIGETAAPALTLVDLCETRLLAYSPAAGSVTLSIARDGTSFVLALSFGEDMMPMPQAAAFLDSVAARVEDPIRQLL